MKYRLMKRMLRTAGVLVLCGMISAMPVSAKSKKKNTPKPLGKVVDAVIEFRQGELSFLEKKGKLKAVSAETISFKSDKTLFSGKRNKDQKLEGAIQNASNSGAVVRLNKSVYVTLAGGSGVSYRLLKDGTVDLNLTGAAHIFAYQKDKDVKIAVRGLTFSTQQGHLYLSDWDKTAQVVLVDGKATVKGQFAVTTNKKGKKKAKKLKKGASKMISLEMQVGSAVAFGKAGHRLIKDSKYDKKLYKASIVSGLSTSGAYRFVGVVEFSTGKMKIKRLEKVVSISKSPALISRGDQIQTVADQTAVLNFFNKDKIRLFANTKFTIDQYPEKKVQKPVKFKFFGKIRAKITKRKKLRRMFFKTATAIIGIKGTEFETSGNNQVMDVKTVEGTVGVTDPSGKGEVLVNAGEQTKVESGKLPEKPKPIPPEELKRLNKDGLAGNKVLEIKDLSIKEGGVYSAVKLGFKVLPPTAKYEVWIDEKLQKGLLSGGVVKGLVDGPHKVTIKGLKGDPFSLTTNITIDNKKPALVEQKGETLVLKEGDPLLFKWSEKLKALEIAFGTLTMKGTLEKDSLSVRFKSGLLFQSFKGKNEALVKIKATDLAGNTADIEQRVTLRFKPTQNPKIEVVDGKKFAILNQLLEIPVQADRKLSDWVVMLDGQKIELTPTKAKKETTDAKVESVEPKVSASLSIPLQTLKEFKEGKHSLVVEGVDDFKMKGKLVFDFVYDKTKPTLLLPITLVGKVGPEDRPLKMEKLVLKEGETLQLKWSEPIQNPSLTLGEKSYKLEIDPETKAVQLSSVALKKVLKKGYVGAYRLKAFDRGGNAAELKGQLNFKLLPKASPKLVIGKGKKEMLVRTIPDFKVSATRAIYGWKILLNDAEVKPKADQPFLSGKTLKIPKVVLGDLKDGKHRLRVSGVDAFSLPVSAELTFKLDATAPQVDKSALDLDLDKIRVMAKKKVMLIWTEDIFLSKATLNGKKWNLKINRDGKTLFIFGDTRRLNYDLKEYEVTVRDKAGNETTLKGKVAIQKPRTTVLKDNYKGSVLYQSDDVMDKVMLSNRLPFTLNESTSGEILKNKRSFKAKYKTKIDYRLNKILDEPLINSYQVP